MRETRKDGRGGDDRWAVRAGRTEARTSARNENDRYMRRHEQCGHGVGRLGTYIDAQWPMVGAARIMPRKSTGEL